MTPSISRWSRWVAALRSPVSVKLLVLITVSTAFAGLLIGADRNDTALLYVGLPYLIAVGLLVFGRSHRPSGLGKTYLWLLKNSLIVFLATSVLLREGFLCVLFFIPIYIALVTLVFMCILMFESANSRWGRTRASIIPLLLLASSIEGVVPEFSFPIHYEVSSGRAVASTPLEIRQRLLQPMDIGLSNNAALALFPMPHKIEAASLEKGAVHRAWFHYRRWIVTNSHEGQVAIEITRSDERVIEAKIISDTTYLSSYLAAQNLRLEMVPIDARHTQVTLSFSFERKLSPAWYFGPLQTHVVKSMAGHLINEVIDHG